MKPGCDEGEGEGEWEKEGEDEGGSGRRREKRGEGGRKKESKVPGREGGSEVMDEEVLLDKSCLCVREERVLEKES